MRFVSLCLLFLCVGFVEARPRKYQPQPVNYQPQPVNYQPQPVNYQPQAGAFDALNEVNAKRAQAGLYPYIRDEGLTQGAMALSAHRAAHNIAGHTSNDFGFLPPGATARASGCCYTPRSDWGACCTTDRGPQYAGAAVYNKNGRWFCSIFVR